jgi:hypothetical protein
MTGTLESDERAQCPQDTGRFAVAQVFPGDYESFWDETQDKSP